MVELSVMGRQSVTKSSVISVLLVVFYIDLITVLLNSQYKKTRIALFVFLQEVN